RVTRSEIGAAELLDEARDLLVVGIVGDGRNKRQHQQQEGETANQPGGHVRLLAKRGQRGARQMRAVPSWLAEAMRLPSGKKATLNPSPAWPSYRRTSLPVSTSQTRTPPSPPETMRFPSGDHAAHEPPPPWAWIRF